jgi:DivIVA domain-containing protein
MRPDEILHRDFLVGLRGYDKDEVRSFLADVAAEHANLLAELDAVRSGAPAPAAPAPAAKAEDEDDFENLGASVAAILKTAKASAAEMTQAAEARAAQTREEIEDLRYRAVVEADELKAAAKATLDEAKAEAARIVQDAKDRARPAEAEAEARIANRAEDAGRREAGIRTRLQEAADELQLALVALDGNGAADVRFTNGSEQPVA